MKRKLLTVLLTLIALFFLCSGLTTCGGNDTEGLQFQEIKGENGEYTAAVVVLGTAWDTDIVIPSSYRGLKVTAIGNNAFNASMDARNANLTSITIPDSVNSIENSAFSSCISLESITIPFVRAKKAFKFN